jgi:hypothetical protein
MKDFNKAVAAYLSSSVRDCINGAGMAFDPAPRCYRKNFITSDAEAFADDLGALILDYTWVMERLLPPPDKWPAEVKDFRSIIRATRTAVRSAETAKREREAV